MRILWIALLLAPLALFGCGDDHGHSHDDGDHSHDDGDGSHDDGDGDGCHEDHGEDHGDAVEIGEVTIAGQTFHVTRLGEIEPGHEAAFEIKLPGSDAKGRAGWELNLWLEDAAGGTVCAATKADLEEHGWHVHAEPRAGSKPATLRLRARGAGKDERGTLELR